ncbi:ABC transporter ATP-binding protein [Palleronia sp. LCG004]|uniref:ABC transporter ATP-binding protein n=1 Tax=Palleronia sp. LCG004 TaxID=3079304 RepID=UPI0029428F70|nr:ABC transporter ATP-binding protein [Palleronia sp. LCG004]WOI56221.1 ABC transporter ATP-binding protein [Palleronia sp. LCG004]
MTLIAATLCITALELVLPVVVLQVYDRILPNMSTETLRILVLGAAALMIVDVVLRFCRSELIARNGAAFAHRAGLLAMGTVLAGNRGGDPVRSSANGTALLSAVRAMKDGNSGQTLVTAFELILAPIAIVLIAAIAGPLALVPLVTLAIFAGFALANGRSFAKTLAHRDQCDGLRFDFVIQALRSVHSIKAMAMEDWFLRRYECLKRDSCETTYGVARNLTRGFDVVASFSTLLTLSIVVGGALMVLAGQITVGAMIASVILSGRIGQPVQKALALYVRRHDFDNARQRANSLLFVPVPERPAPSEPPANTGSLRLLGFSCGNDDDPDRVDCADLRIEPGDLCLLETASGNSPSALFRAIAGLDRPNNGEVLLNDREPHLLPENIRAAQVAFLQRDGVIYRGTLMDNLSSFGRSPLTDVFYVARLLGLEADIAALPRGLDTPLDGSGSDPIPPGLKQRATLVRQLAPRPRLILFDHADTGLDRRSYTAVYELFTRLKGRATIVLTTRDRNMRDLATRHLRIAGGRIEEVPIVAPRSLALSTYRELRI